ncbi:cell division protein FtsL [Psychrobacter sp. I-STPA6b]|uniref:cell division protein FtsL n=1 Tax=Psychrobacter sp. I-STPA6b TaxID=2585718 RepID=UPI001D0C822F|nr:cell division protein FtsL [Psychrobacter sp. I-STPA6b]
MSRLSHLIHRPSNKGGTSKKPQSSGEMTQDISDILSKRYRGISVYAVVMLLIAIAIIWTGVLTTEQIQSYRQDYLILQDMKRQERRLQVEYQRLLIEQQTFSATPQIASRAVTELGMYSPSVQDKLILQPTVQRQTNSNPIDDNNETNDSMVEQSQVVEAGR